MVAAMAVVAGAAPAAVADVGPVNPVRVLVDGHPANSGFLVFVEGNAFLNADESEGTLAVGGNLAFGSTYNIAAAAPAFGTFTAPNDTQPTYLFVGGGMDFTQSDGGDILRVLNQGYAKVALTSTYAAFDRDQNNALINYHITVPTGTAETIPRVEGTITQTPASIGTTVPSNLINIAGAFNTYRGLSTDLGTCPATVVLTDDAGNPLTSPFAPGTRAHVTLAENQTNVLDISAADLASLGELAFDDQPTLTGPLLVNVTGTSFEGTMPNSPGISSTQAPFILYNFPQATSVTVTGGDSLEGTIYAPRANLTWLVTQNIEGNVIASSFTHGQPAPVPGQPREVHDIPFRAELSCVTPPTTAELTLVKVVSGGGPASPADWDLSADGPTPITGTSGTDPVTAAVVDPGDYSLSESVGPVDYEPGPWVCVGAPVVDDVVTLAPGDSATCTVINFYTGAEPGPAHLTLVKVVDGGPAQSGDWDLSADGPTPISGESGTAAVTAAEVDPGEYTLDESEGPPGYSAGDWTCEGATVLDGIVTLSTGDDATCTIVNTYTGADPTLTLVKVVRGGAAAATDWVLSASGATPVSGVSGTPAVTAAEVQPGEYTLSESGGPDGYTPGAWTCTGAIVVGAVITVDWGDDIVCTITNTSAATELVATGVDSGRPAVMASALLLIGVLLLVSATLRRRRSD